MWQAFLINFWQLSAILLTSSPLKVCQVGWGRSTFSGFSRNIWLGSSPDFGGHSRTFTELPVSLSCWVFRFIVLLEGGPSAQSEVLNALDWVFIKATSICWCKILSPSVPALPQSLPLCLHWIEFGHTAIKPRSVECCSDVCYSVSFSDLHIWSWSLTRVTIRFLVTTLTKTLLHQLLCLARRPALGRILVVSNFFY